MSVLTDDRTFFQVYSLREQGRGYREIIDSIGLTSDERDLCRDFNKACARKGVQPPDKKEPEVVAMLREMQHKTVREVADITGLHTSTIYWHAKRHRLIFNAGNNEPKVTDAEVIEAFNNGGLESVKRLMKDKGHHGTATASARLRRMAREGKVDYKFKTTRPFVRRQTEEITRAPIQYEDAPLSMFVPADV